MVTAPPAPPAPPKAEISSRLEMTFGQPIRQRRATVFFRPILAIPQLVVLYFVNIAALVLVFLGWFAALFTGRLPESVATFVVGNLRWRARVEGYLFLLSDRYPPFSLQPAVDYPIDVVVQTGRLNRWSVLFRYFLAFPAALAVSLLSMGLSIFWIVTWVATLVKGTTPRSLFEANAAALRYSYRLLAYFYMLTSYYPSGVMGDEGLPLSAGLPSLGPQPGPPSSVGIPPAVPRWQPDGSPVVEAAMPPPPSSSQPQSTEAEDGASASPVPAGFGSQPAPAAQPPPAPPLPPPSLPPPYPAPAGADQLVDRWRLVLSAGARRLIVAFFVVGGLGFVAYIGAVVAVTSNRVTTANQANTAQHALVTAYKQLGVQSQSFVAATKACASSSGVAASQCLTSADALFVSDLQGYEHTVGSINFPSQVTTQVAAVTSATSAASAELQQLSQLGSDPQAYVSAARNSNLQVLFDHIDSTSRTLNSALIAL
jgi:Domain of unknown function (DUF4389)